jgi:hypothetical protein
MSIFRSFELAEMVASKEDMEDPEKQRWIFFILEWAGFQRPTAQEISRYFVRRYRATMKPDPFPCLQENSDG